MAGEPAGDFPGVGEGRGARGRDTAMCGTSPDRDHEDSGDKYIMVKCLSVTKNDHFL